MGAFSSVDAELDRLEKDRGFQAAVSAIRPGIISKARGGADDLAYRRYTTELDRFFEDDDLMDELAADPMLRIWLFRVFGYRGELRFALMPRVWMRDLPLLEIGRDAHLGYGMVLRSSTIAPDGESVRLSRIEIGPRSRFFQNAMVAGGARVGPDCLVGIRGRIGEGACLGERVEVGDFASVGYGAVIGAGARIGHSASVGAGAVIDPGLELPDGESVPAEHRLTAAGLFPMLVRRIAA